MWGKSLLLVLAITPAFAQAKKSKAQVRKLTCEAPKAQPRKSEAPMPIIKLQREARLNHARELLGKYYRHSTVRTGERVKKINNRIYAWTKEKLPPKFKSQYKRIAQAIIDESARHEFDPVFLLSVIQNESSFDPHRLGALDEIGLMQLRPGTAAWISPKYHLKYRGDKSLKDPVQNIKIGTAYMDFLREKFDSHAQLYLSAYNMGDRNVKEAINQNVWPKDYAGNVMRFYVDFYKDLKSDLRKPASVKSAPVPVKKKKKTGTVVALNSKTP